LAERLVRPPSSLAPLLRLGFDEMIGEFQQRQFGHEVRLRTLLMEMLVKLLRWEQQTGRELKMTASTTAWKHVERALNFVREHFAEDVYARDLAKVAGVSQSRLKELFHEYLGMPWSRYLQSYRINRAAAMLGQPGYSVLETALAVGFESVSHFNTVFRSLMGVPPREYAQRAAGKKAGCGGARPEANGGPASELR
ncbi:MAG: helix-turn-helix transcriptional regulator, partial [Verrucomicrobiae bacterium]|nr:helix-turn-helix transcriptional regulator [Verrucomicrobiae bacterium]